MNPRLAHPPEQRASITIKDVARLANVSVATVSRTMNGHQHVAEPVRARVLEAARTLHYVPHHAARSLSSRRTHTIGVVLPDLHGEFFSELIRGIDLIARERGLHLLVSSYHGEPEEQRLAVRRMPGRVDGLLLMSPSLGTGSEDAADMLPGALPAVLMNCAERIADAQVLNVDNYGGARAMTRHLLDSGHRRIAFIAGPDDNFDARERLRGYRDELRERCPQVPPRVLPGDFDEASGYRAGQALLQGQRPDVVFAANDMMALGCLFAFTNAGLRVPDDIALAGFDDVPMARYVHPALTTMRVDIAGFGARAMQLLIAALEPHSAAPAAEAALATDIVPQLIVRASSGQRGTAMD
ncbi:LacI family transcriptional regulator [Xanthomonas translucens pv. arrhenatheri]|uniref:LacI family transcriptional regulator n=1 Tax=Xanthomonas graminis pv. arrhenatheri LMG 727 TaxID=1195923 RepID=A0A0K2ZUQ9_9XANT|nr:LacI family DNA-binding transcriptional regulator [Xanthomonas translucens]OAX65810.1 LacI family transcriptional regulator [Xanthomonas translucens pv. arrhenatheri]UKE77636.1 LacI family transcriptional regulator [Xanthomonas translucens pv. arrhenatheri]CTP89368.1 LacI family transcriptional regulator [Xanthomonas translucens pv. arrhenatheri LMG 727]